MDSSEGYNKENAITLISQSHPSTPPGLPLSSKRSLNSLNSLNGSPLAYYTKKTDGSPSRSVSTSSASSTSLGSLQKEYNSLERRYTDLVLQNKSLLVEFTALEQDVHIKTTQLKEQAEKNRNYELFIKSIQDEHNKSSDLLTREISFYKELLQEVQSNLDKLTAEFDSYRQKSIANSPSQEHDSQNDISYERLSKEYRALQSNFELEKTSKTVLIDQIDYLTKENEALRMEQQRDSLASQNFISDDILDSSVIHDITHTIHTMNDYNDHNEINNNNSSNNNNSNMISYLADELRNNHSSPIKAEYNTDESMEISRNFQFPPPEFAESNFLPKTEKLESSSKIQFPPSPEPGVKEKRQSLPLHLRGSQCDEEFVLSPFKLANATISLIGNDDRVVPSVKRYSSSKPNHNRYNSHEIVPIMVEFEPLESALRSTSVPEKAHHNNNSHKFDIINESSEGSVENSKTASARDGAFFALNGYDSKSNRNSATMMSSKRSSLISENYSNDITRHEITKLKFELQSLRLHNEKLLSYIGFELQKQKKNIKKLTKKQSTRTLRSYPSKKKMEYSDAKLIERSKEMLIQKKRVLRSVSINAILSKKYHDNSGMRPTNAIGIIPTGLSPFANSLFTTFENEFEQDEDGLSLHNDLGEDEYGFLTHNDRFSSRVFSNGLYAYLNFDENELDGDETADCDKERRIKKYRSQVFEKSKFASSDDEAGEDGTDEATEVEKDDWEEISGESSSEEELGMITQIKYLMFGASALSAKQKRKKDQHSLVDDGLKYKFFTIALGIMIIGLKFSHQHYDN
ncbi:predicted protein [Scheffersomyces stipitis CBS 6054]|uniref:Uncharacterized protein n=1 Tax=Scheffersomyces stipitis (strain ATCC 58785 / CBS 6054 / NBRC 10063 / NRRL Y-11545) TaxID=322104 RepID=A3LZF1_PICST|nr:predicted protein [Scheffersomyces stipitis CBS 6054]ABN68149.2 predicted protein [Scheffersomyces stipitis CBS 6054]